MESKANKIGKGADAELNKRVAEVITKLMKHSDVRQSDLAEDLYMTPSGLSRIKNGKQNATPIIVTALCEKYNVSPDFLVLGEGEMFKKLITSE